MGQNGPTRFIVAFDCLFFFFLAADSIFCRKDCFGVQTTNVMGVISNRGMRVVIWHLILNLTFGCFSLLLFAYGKLFLHILVIVINFHVRKQFQRSGKFLATTTCYSFVIFFLKRIYLFKCLKWYINPCCSKIKWYINPKECSVIVLAFIYWD